MGHVLRNRQDFGAGHRSSELGAGARIGPAIRAGGSMGEQRDGESA